MEHSAEHQRYRVDARIDFDAHREELPASPTATISDICDFEHTPLDHTIDSIRLIEILPDLSPQALLQVSIHHTTTGAVPYTCLSYEWRSEDEGGAYILVNGRQHYVRQNLLDFLEATRMKRHDSKRIWIDALYIDQRDDSERGHQVLQMGTIYSKAREVWI
ncbi:hypothetical protein CC86DRAFT_375733 [Ophiobolus disseminans]|uniref:Heterokaryon incompatibility domain-containing protein n=1 Tax=Ophiobolus disseminans TaxID=1469910 RepID=A0A6A6ZBP4_9PLEO|nr:hypothetical protein CC86DRAFT_375733 [Ophiobolus disseminans]